MRQPNLQEAISRLRFEKRQLDRELNELSDRSYINEELEDRLIRRVGGFDIAIRLLELYQEGLDAPK